MGKRKKSAAQLSRNAKKGSKLIGGSTEINDRTNSWLKKMLRKLFTVQSATLALSIIMTIIACWQCHDAQKGLELAMLENIESKIRLEMAQQKSIKEDSIKYHDGLVLRFGNFEIRNGETYNIDIVRPYDPIIGAFIFKFQLTNMGKLDAKNILIRFGGKNKCIVMKAMHSKDFISYEQGGGEITIEYMHPQEGMEIGVLYISRDRRQGIQDNCRFVCVCENKANPFIVYFNMRIYNFDDIKSYSSYMLSKYGSQEAVERYWADENTFIMHSTYKNVEGITNYDAIVYKIIKDGDSIKTVKMDY